VAKAKKKKDVYLYFGPHASASKFFPNKPRRKVKIFLSETGMASAENADKIIRGRLKNYESRYSNEQRKMFSKVLEDNGIVTSAEVLSEKEQKKFLNLDQQAFLAGDQVFNPAASVSQILTAMRKLKRVEAQIIKWRERLIVEAVKKSEKPVAGRYGTAHSILRKKLRKEGVKMQSKTASMLFDWHTLAGRKVVSGKRLSDIDCLRAFLTLVSDMPVMTVKKKWSELNDADAVFVCACDHELLKRLNRKQLVEIIESQDYRKIFTLNGLPKNPTKKQLKEWLQNNSIFWKRQGYTN